MIRRGVMLLILIGMLATGYISIMSQIGSAQVAPAPPAPGGTFAQRLDQRKRERAITLEEKDQKRLSGRCVAMQGNIRELQQKLAPVVNNRTKVYQRIDAKLLIAIGQLKLAEKDTFELEKRRVALADKSTAFQAITADYLQSLDDLVIINCQADIIGFKALLETARLYHGQVRTQSSDIRAYVIDVIKVSLSEQASALQPKTGAQ